MGAVYDGSVDGACRAYLIAHTRPNLRQHTLAQYLLDMGATDLEITSRLVPVELEPVAAGLDKLQARPKRMSPDLSRRVANVYIGGKTGPFHYLPGDLKDGPGIEVIYGIEATVYRAMGVMFYKPLIHCWPYEYRVALPSKQSGPDTAFARLCYHHVSSPRVKRGQKAHILDNQSDDGPNLFVPV